MDLSIIIVNFRAWKHLQACLDSLQYLANSARLSCEVIVVDNQSRDGQLDTFRQSHGWVQWLENTANRGFASGCNLGAAKSRGQCLLFLNPDCLDPHQAIVQVWAKAAGLAQITSVSQQGPQGDSRKVGGQFPRWWAVAGPGRVLMSLVRRLTPTMAAKSWVSGSFLMIGRKQFEQLGGWDDQYWMYSEDVDLCRRGHQLGIECRIYPEHLITHHHGGSSRISAAIRALTRSEVVISRHRYCQQHFKGTARPLAHCLIGVFEALPLIAASWIAPDSSVGQRGTYLRAFYQKVRRSGQTAGQTHGQWHSPHVDQPPTL